MNRLQTAVAGWVSRNWSTKSLVLGGIGVVLGVLSGAGVWLFKRLIDLANLGAFQWLGGIPRSIWQLDAVPGAGDRAA